MRTFSSLFASFLLLLGGVFLPQGIPDAEANPSDRIVIRAGTRTLSYFLRTPQAGQRSLVALFPGVIALAGSEGESTAEAGSVPLSPALEQRLERYITNDNCPVTLDRAIHERCQFLLKQSRLQLGKEREGTRLSPRASGILRRVEGGKVIRRTIGGEHQRRLQSAAEALYLRQEKAGFRRRLRTLEDVRARYQGLSVERSRGETRLSTTPPPPPPPPAGE